jgi:hypothetical protein
LERFRDRENKQTNKISCLGVGTCCGYDDDDGDDGCVEL